MVLRDWIELAEQLNQAPLVVQRAARGDWPEVLSGLEFEQIYVLIDHGMESANWFSTVWEEAVENGEVGNADVTARLETVSIASLDMPDEGIADPELVGDYAVMDTNPPPVFVFGNTLRDGYHRVAVAQQKGLDTILAYRIV